MVGKAWNLEADRLEFKSQHPADTTEINTCFSFSSYRSGLLIETYPRVLTRGSGGSAHTKTRTVAAAGGGVWPLAPNPSD